MRAATAGESRAFAEVLLGWHPASPDARDLILDPDALARVCGRPDLPGFPPPVYRHTDHGGIGTFFSWQLRAVDGHNGNTLDVYEWTVRSWPDQPAQWWRRQVVIGVPVNVPILLQAAAR